MRKNNIRSTALALVIPILFLWPACARAQAAKAPYQVMALPALAPGAMCYMMAKQQYLSDDDTNWHPHLMFFVSGDAVKSWGANLPGSPVIAGSDPEERA